MDALCLQCSYFSSDFRIKLLCLHVSPKENNNPGLSHKKLPLKSKKNLPDP